MVKEAEEGAACLLENVIRLCSFCPGSCPEKCTSLLLSISLKSARCGKERRTKAFLRTSMSEVRRNEQTLCRVFFGRSWCGPPFDFSFGKKH